MSAFLTVASGLYKVGSTVVVGEREKNAATRQLSDISNANEDTDYLSKISVGKTFVTGVKSAGPIVPIAIVGAVIIGAILIGKTSRKRKRK